MIGKKICSNETLPKHLIVDKIEIHDAKSIAEKLMNFLSKLGQILLTRFRNVT